MTTTQEAQARRANNAFSWQFVTPMFLGSALNPVNSSLIATALVPIATAMGVSVGRTAVLVSSLYLASSIAQPTAGKLAEEFGPRRVFLAGIALVLAGGLAGGFARNLAMLIVARVLIGIGTSAGYPSAMLLIRRRATQAGLSAPPGSVLGGLVIAGMVTPAIGLPLGGVLVGAWDWRATFFFNIPLTAVTFIMATIWIPKDKNEFKPLNGHGLAARIDLLGIVGFGAAMTSLIVFLMALPRLNWLSLGIAIAAFAALAWWELRASRPFLDIRLLASNRALTLTYLRYLILCLCLYTVLYGVTQWLQVSRGLTALAAGLVQLPMSLASAVIARPVSQRNLLRTPLVIAAASCLAGAATVLLLTSHTAIALIVVATLLFGVAMGAGASANQTALYAAVPAEQIGTASGLLRTSGYIGSIASSAILSITFRNGVTDHGLHVIAVIMVAVSALCLVITLADRKLMSLAEPPDKARNQATPDSRSGLGQGQA